MTPDGEWRRDAAPMVVCSCGHPAEEHRCDLSRARCGASANGGWNDCPCPELTPARLRWREHRWVTEELS